MEEETMTTEETPEVSAETVEPAKSAEPAVSPATKKTFPTWVIAAIAAVVTLLVAAFAFSSLSNNYKTPLKLQMNRFNARTFSSEKFAVSQLNGLGEKQLKKVLKAMSKSEDFADELEETDERINEYLEDYYGKRRKAKYEIEDSVALEKSELREIRNAIRDEVRSMERELDEFNEMSSSDWMDFADDVDMSVKEAKALVKAMKAFVKAFSDIKVTKGYLVEYTTVISGSELDEPQEMPSEMTVVKVNGRWVDASMITSFSNLLDF